MQFATKSARSATARASSSSRRVGVARSNAALYTCARRASSAHSTVPSPVWAAASASSVETGAHSVSRGKARPLTAARPMRSPVKLPGPALTPYKSISAQVMPHIFRQVSIMGISVSLWVMPASRYTSYSRRSSCKRATPAVLPAVSTAKMFIALPPQW